MLLAETCEIRTRFPDAEFWLIRKGSLKTVGKPTRDYDPEHIGITVTAAQLLLPGWLFYAMEHIHLTGYWQRHCHGTLALQHIRVSDVKRIRLA